MVDAVIIVAAYINNSKCQTMINGGKVLALNVLRIINEATGPAIAYGVDNKADRRCEWRSQRRRRGQLSAGALATLTDAT